MKGNIELRIPTPCAENWEDMRPDENGRYCGTCSKTVVDFSMMSDREIIAWLARAGQHVCGRMSADQLNRRMALQPDAGRSHRVWWKWLLAGLLISSEARAQRLPVVIVTSSPPKRRVDNPTQGLMVMSRRLPDSIPTKKDSIQVKELPPVVVKGYRSMGKVDVTGEVMTVTSTSTKTDTVTQWIQDTLTTIGLVPKKEWNVYPNPVRRGAAVMLTRVDAGTYDVGLFDSQGDLIRQRVLQVDSKDQVDLLDIPATLAPGTYFLRWTPAGKGSGIEKRGSGSSKTVTRTLVVL